MVKLGVFVVFGSLLTFHSLFAEGWAAVGIVAGGFRVARPVAVFAALAGTPFDTATKAFMAWFGPKGVATMTFSLLILGDGLRAGERIFNLAALAVFCSVLVHGLTDTPGSNWLADHAERRARSAGPPGSGRSGASGGAGDDIVLNGKPIYLKGICLHEDHVEKGKTTDEATMRAAIAHLRELHGNYLKARALSPRCALRADRRRGGRAALGGDPGLLGHRLREARDLR